MIAADVEKTTLIDLLIKLLSLSTVDAVIVAKPALVKGVPSTVSVSSGLGPPDISSTFTKP